jgi:transcriptional regulator with XRE-family HTH domain
MDKGADTVRLVATAKHDPATQRFADNLRALRTQKGMTQEMLADVTGLHPTAVARLETAVRDPRLHTLVRIARGLDVSVSDLVRDVEA